MHRRQLILFLALVTFGAVLVPPALAATGGGASRWVRTASFLSSQAIVDPTLRAEAARDGRAIVTFTRTGIESSCGHSKTRLLGLDGEWNHRPTVRKVSNSRQVQLVAGKRLAWLGGRCSGEVELRYVNRRAWKEPSILDGLHYSALRAGMNSAGLVALAQPSDGAIEVFTARPGEAWSAVAPLSTGGAQAIVDHVAVTRSEELLVVWHAGTDMYVSTLAAGVWSTADVPGDPSINAVAAGSDTAGNILIARASADTLYASFRSPDGSITEPEPVGDDLAYGCNYDCVAVEMLPGGDAFVAWSAEGLQLSRRDAGTGAWATERVADRFSALDVRLDAHADGGVVAIDSSGQDVYLCSWTSSCSRDDYPPGTDHGMFAAAPAGVVVGISGLSFCDDWCDFEDLDGWQRP